MYKKLLFIILIVAMMSMLSVVPVASQETTTLTFMGWIGLFEFYIPSWEYMVDEFEAQNPGVEIEYIGVPFEEMANQATTAVLGNNAPDVFQLVSGWTPQMNGLGALTALEPLVDSAVLEGIPEGPRDAVTFDGQLMAMPWVPAPIVMVYNRNLMEEAGLDPDQPPVTWEEFAAAVDAICALPDRENGGNVFGVSLRSFRNPNSGHWSIPVIWGFGGDVLNPDGSVVVAEQGAVNAYQWYQDVVSSECSPNGANPLESRTVFGQGRAGFMFEGPWAKGLVHSLSEDELTVAPDGDVWVAPMPAGPDGRVRMIANSHVLAISEQSENKELAADFITFITTDPESVTRYYEVSEQLSTAQIDLLTTGDIGEDEYIQVFVEALPGAISVPIKHPQWNAMTDNLSLAIQRVIQGEDPATVLADAAEEIELLLEDG